MKIKLGIVGFERRIEKIRNTIEKYYKDIEVVNLSIDKNPYIKDISNMILTYEQYLDGIIFTGEVLYGKLININIPKIPWDYIHRDSKQILKAFIRIGLEYKANISNVSIDSFNTETALRVYDEINISRESLDIHVFDTKSFYENTYSDSLLDFHERNYSDGKVSFCITGMYNVYTQLTQKKIPCIVMEPSEDTIQQTIQRILLRNEALVNKQSQIIALSISIDNTSEYSLLNNNEYQTVMEKMKITKYIYQFSQKIEGAVVEEGLRRYFIFCTKNMLDKETNNIRNMPLLKTISDKTPYTVSIGIGYGITAREAKSSANLGMMKAEKTGGNRAYIVYNEKNYSGPIMSEHDEDDRKYKIIDEKFNKISEDTGLGIDTIFKLHTIVAQNNKDRFTPRELSEYFGVTLRSINRILEKLEAGGYSKIIGKKAMSTAGRPSRIVQLLLDD